MESSKIERYLAGQAVEMINLPAGKDYFLRYFKYVHNRGEPEESKLYGIMVDIFKNEFPDYFDVPSQ